MGAPPCVHGSPPLPTFDSALTAAALRADAHYGRSWGGPTHLWVADGYLKVLLAQNVGIWGELTNVFLKFWRLRLRRSTYRSTKWWNGD